MKLKRLYEAKGGGTFVGIRLTSDSTARLCGWMDQNLLKEPQPANEIHTTLVLDKTSPFLHDPMTYDPSIPIDPATYSLDLFGPDKNIMVLKYDSPFLQKRHAQLLDKYGLSWDWPEYSPHITLTYAVQEIATEFEPPEFELEISHEYVEAFNPNWEK